MTLREHLLFLRFDAGAKGFTCQSSLHSFFLIRVNFKLRYALPAIAFAYLIVCASAGAQQQTASTQSDSSSAQNTQKIQPVTTTVVVQGQIPEDYLPIELSAGNLDNLPLISTPVSAMVLTRDLMNDQVSRSAFRCSKERCLDWGKIMLLYGYYGDYQIRGFAIDLATGLQINGMPIAGEQDVPLENKQQVEFLKGIAGVESA